MARVICFANNKGGSGKSTTCANVGYSLSVLGQRVLLIDGDMQMNLTLSFFSEEDALAMARSRRNLYTVIRSGADIADCVRETAYPGLSLVPSSLLMSGIEYEVFSKKRRTDLLEKALAPVAGSGAYDVILIDAPPTLGSWTMNLLCASDEVIVPVEASPWGLFGLANLFDHLAQARKSRPELAVGGIVLTKVNERKNYFRQTLESLRELGDVKVFDTYIRVDSAIEWAQDVSQPVMAYKKSARSAGEYMELAKEIMNDGSR